MLDNVLGLIKNTASNYISSNSAIPEDKKEATVNTTAHAIGEGLQQNLSLSNLSGLTSLFSNNNAGVSNSNPIVNSITNNVVSSLVQKVGLPQGIANTVASSVVPIVMKAISGKVNDPNEKGFNLESLVQSFTGGGNNSGSENIMGTIGKLFGK